MLTWKCNSHHNGVHFFDIATSKSAPKLRCFVHFDFEMCFAPQRRALFRHLNFQKWSKHGVLCTFWLGNVLRATTPCNLPSLISPDGSAPAALASLLFDPPEPQIIVKTQCFTTFLPFCAPIPFRAPGSSFFWLCLFCDLLSSSLLFSDSSHLCFSICPYCREVWLLNFLRQLQLQTLITVNYATLDCTTLHYSTLILITPQTTTTTAASTITTTTSLRYTNYTTTTLQNTTLHYSTQH